MKIDERTLHHQFVKLGNNRRRLTNELLALLPEIYEREIYKKYAKTIEEYAGKFGGLSGGVVEKRLRLEKYIKDKPELRDAIRTEGVHKVALVASLATRENDRLLADKVKNMSKPALQELSKELRDKAGKSKLNWHNCVNRSLFEVNNGEFAKADCKTAPCSAAPQHIKIDLEDDLLFMFLKLKKKYGEKLSNTEVMKKIFEENLNSDIEHKGIKNDKNAQLQSVKVIPGESLARQGIQTNSKIEVETKFKNKQHKIIKSRYISIHLRRNLLQKMGGRCSYPNCNKPAEVFHHTERFAEIKNHHSIKPLCKIHHEFMHNGLVMNQTNDQRGWQLDLDGELTYADYFYRRYRKT